VQEERADGQTRYRVRLARRARRELPTRIWQALDQEPDAQSAGAQLAPEIHKAGKFRNWISAVFAAGAGRFWLCATPVILIWLIAEWLTLTNSQSFTWALSLGGVLAAPIFGGIFPVLLLASSRRKGNMVPQVFYRFVGHPVVLAALYVLFLSSLFAYGLFIWQTIPERAAALLAGLIVLGMTALAIRRGAMRPRVVVELRQEAPDQAHFSVIAGGALARAGVSLRYRDHETRLEGAEGLVLDLSSLCGAAFEIDTPARELEVWAHQVTPEGNSTSLPARLTVSSVDDPACAQVNLQLSAGPLLVPLSCARCRVELTFDKS